LCGKLGEYKEYCKEGGGRGVETGKGIKRKKNNIK
jgi:hypothetical protein